MRTFPRGASILIRWVGSLVTGAIAVGSVIGVSYYDVRLPADQSWILIVLAATALLFSILAIYSVTGAIRSSLSARTAETEVELEDVDLHPGSRTALHVLQRGPVHLNRLRVSLRCDELETVTISWSVLETDEEREIERTVRREDSQRFETPQEWSLLERDAISIDERTPFETTIELAIPDEALPTGTSTQLERPTAESMPSLVPWDATGVRRTVETKVNWRIIVVGEIDGGVDFTHEFPIVVLISSPTD